MIYKRSSYWFCEVDYKDGCDTVIYGPYETRELCEVIFKALSLPPKPQVTEKLYAYTSRR